MNDSCVYIRCHIPDYHNIIKGQLYGRIFSESSQQALNSTWFGGTINHFSHFNDLIKQSDISPYKPVSNMLSAEHKLPVLTLSCAIHKELFLWPGKVSLLFSCHVHTQLCVWASRLLVWVCHTNYFLFRVVWRAFLWNVCLFFNPLVAISYLCSSNPRHVKAVYASNWCQHKPLSIMNWTWNEISSCPCRPLCHCALCIACACADCALHFENTGLYVFFPNQ